MSEVRAHKLEVGDVIQMTVEGTIVYNKQSHIHVGDLLIGFDESGRLHHSWDVVYPPKEPRAIFRTVQIKYKSRFHRWFRRFLKTPIKWIRAEYMGGA